MDLFFAASLLLYTASAASAAGNVYHLNEQDFGSYLRDKDVMLVDFYAPWCPHCKDLDPELDAAADTMATKNSYVFAKVDCANDGKSLCERMQVPGYPTLKVFKYGRWVGDYTGGHDRGSILNYVQSVTSPAAQQAGLSSQPNNVPATLGQAIESRPRPAGFQAYRPQAPYQSHLSYQSQTPQLPGARPATPYFNSFLNKNAGAQADPSLLGSFYKGPQQPAPGPAMAYAGKAPPAKIEPEKAPSRSPDSLRAKFGSLAALRVYQAKLKMLAAYKNWHKRIAIFQKRVKEFKAQHYGIAGAKTAPPEPPQAAAYHAQAPSPYGTAAPYYQDATQTPPPAPSYQPYNQYQQPAAYASYRSKLNRQTAMKQRPVQQPIAAAGRPQFRAQPQPQAPQAFTASNHPWFHAQPLVQQPFNTATHSQFRAQPQQMQRPVAQAAFAGRPAAQTPQPLVRANPQQTLLQQQQQAPVQQQAAISSPETKPSYSEDLESLKADLADSLADFTKHEKAKAVSDKPQEAPKSQDPQTQSNKNIDDSKNANTNPDSQDLSSLGLEADAKKVKATPSGKTQSPEDALAKDIDANSSSSSAQKPEEKPAGDKPAEDSKDKPEDKAKDSTDNKTKEDLEEKKMNEEDGSGDAPLDKRDKTPKPH